MTVMHSTIYTLSTIKAIYDDWQSTSIVKVRILVLLSEGTENNFILDIEYSSQHEVKTVPDPASVRSGEVEEVEA